MPRRTSGSPPVRRYADAVALRAEMRAEGAYEPHPSLGVRQAVEPRHARGAAGLQLRHGLQHARVRNEASLRPVGALAYGHQLYETDLHGQLPREFHHARYLRLTLAADEDGVYLHRLEVVQRGAQARESGFQLSDARHLAVALRREGVEADIHPAQARAAQVGREAGQEQAVRRHADLLHARGSRRARADIHDAAPHQRFPARQAYLAYAAAARREGDLLQRLNAQDVLVPPFLHTPRRHAVDAAQVAQIRHRKAEIIYISSVTVTHPPTSFRSAAEGRGV